VHPFVDPARRLHRPRRPTAARRRRRARTALLAPALAALVGLSLFVSACGGSSGSHVAQLGSSTTNTTQRSPSTNSSAPSTQGNRVAYSQCMRSNGVFDYPDPNSSGGTDKSRITAARSEAGSSRFDTALDACKHLLPPSQPGPTPAEVQQVMNAMANVARCIRSHGVPNWPDPYLDAGRPTFDIHSIDYKAPPISAAIHQCHHLMPGSTLPRICSSLLGTPGNEGCFEGL
jgi:hypothetical protein